jgi:hypothetical protein
MNSLWRGKKTIASTSSQTDRGSRVTVCEYSGAVPERCSPELHYLKFNSWAIIANVEENQPVAGKTRLTLGTNILGTPGVTLACSENVYGA